MVYCFRLWYSFLCVVIRNINLKSVHSKFLSHIAVVWVSYVNGPGFFQGFSLL